MKKIVLSVIVLLSFVLNGQASWTLWQPTHIFNNGDGTLTVTCENYGMVYCMTHSGDSNTPTPGDEVLVRDGDNILGYFILVGIESFGEVYENPPIEHTSGAWSIDVEQIN